MLCLKMIIVCFFTQILALILICPDVNDKYIFVKETTISNNTLFVCELC